MDVEAGFETYHSCSTTADNDHVLSAILNESFRRHSLGVWRVVIGVVAVKEGSGGGRGGEVVTL